MQSLYSNHPTVTLEPTPLSQARPDVSLQVHSNSLEIHASSIQNQEIESQVQSNNSQNETASKKVKEGVLSLIINFIATTISQEQWIKQGSLTAAEIKKQIMEREAINKERVNKEKK